MGGPLGVGKKGTAYVLPDAGERLMSIKGCCGCHQRDSLMGYALDHIGSMSLA